MKIDGTWYRSVRVDAEDGWSVRILDQTKLPWQVEWLHRLTPSLCMFATKSPKPPLNDWR